MSLVLRAQVALEEGCKLAYDPPLGGEDFKSKQFFENYRGKTAYFAGYTEKLLGPLNYQGRKPGRYLNEDGIQVRFEGESEVQSLNFRHFVVADPFKATIVACSKDERWIGDFMNPVLFYPDDSIRFLKKPAKVEIFDGGMRKVRSVFLDEPFTSNAIPRYEVMETEFEAQARIRKFKKENDARPPEQRLWSNPMQHLRGWNTLAEDLELVSRGNVWNLYHDPSKLSFDSEKEELSFWAMDGVSKFVENGSSLSWQKACELFLSGQIDVIEEPSYSRPNERKFCGKRLHDIFAVHRDRVRKLVEKIHQIQFVLV